LTTLQNNKTSSHIPRSLNITFEGSIRPLLNSLYSKATYLQRSAALHCFQLGTYLPHVSFVSARDL